MRAHWVIVALLVASTVLIGWWWSPGTEPEPESGTSRAGEANAAGARQGSTEPSVNERLMRNGLVNLDRRLTDLERETAREMSAGEEGDGTGAVDRTEDTRPVHPYAHLPPAEQDAAIAADFDELIDAQPRDEEWSVETEERIVASVSKTDGRVRITEARCKTTLCRVELAHSDAGERERDLDELTIQPPFNTGGWVRMLEGDPPTTVVYFTRKGHSLPTPEALAAN